MYQIILILCVIAVLFAVLLWLIKDIVIELRYRNTLLEKQNELLQKSLIKKG